MSTAALSTRQKAILDYIRATVNNRGYPPTVREIGEAVGLVSPSSVAYQLNVLHHLGHIRKDPGVPRGYVVPRDKDPELVRALRVVKAATAWRDTVTRAGSNEEAAVDELFDAVCDWETGRNP